MIFCRFFANTRSVELKVPMRVLEKSIILFIIIHKNKVQWFVKNKITSTFIAREFHWETLNYWLQCLFSLEDISRVFLLFFIVFVQRRKKKKPLLCCVMWVCWFDYSLTVIRGRNYVSTFIFYFIFMLSVFLYEYDLAKLIAFQVNSWKNKRFLISLWSIYIRWHNIIIYIFRAWNVQYNNNNLHWWNRENPYRIYPFRKYFS